MELSGPFSGSLSPEDNLVTRAARGFFEVLAIDGGVALHLEKNLPIASGIGGGSADAGAALRLLARLHGIAHDDTRLVRLAAALGADVPACLASVTVRGEGRGDRLIPVPGAGLTGTPLLLVNPGLPLATGDVFRAWEGVDRGPLSDGDPLAAALAGRNDLEAPARRLLPPIENLLGLLAEQPGATLVRMSGSGATCFALFRSDAARDAADRAVGIAAPGWWRLVSRLR